MGTTTLNNAAVRLRLCGTKVLGMVQCGHGYWYGYIIMLIGMGMGINIGMGMAMYEGKNGWLPPCGRALVWCAYTKGRAFGDSAFCEQPIVAA